MGIGFKTVSGALGHYHKVGITSLITHHVYIKLKKA